MNEHKWYKERDFWVTYIVSMVICIGIGASFNTNGSNQTYVAPAAQQEQDNSVQVKPAEVKKPDPITLSGSGQAATAQFDLKEGLATFKLTHSGDSNFGVTLMDDRGNYIEGLVNEIGAFDGSKAARIDKGGKYLLDVSADGDWAVTIQQ